MDLFEQAKKAAEAAAENFIEQKTGQHVDLDGSDKAVTTAETDATGDDTPTPAATEANPLMDNVMAAAKNMAMPLIEEKLKMDLDGDGQIGK